MNKSGSKSRLDLFFAIYSPLGTFIDNVQELTFFIFFFLVSTMNYEINKKSNVKNMINDFVSSRNASSALVIDAETLLTSTAHYTRVV